MFFVAGITGHVGGAAARYLLQQGRQVRALVRDRNKARAWSQRGVDLRVGNFEDPATVIHSLQDVEGAFLMLPPIPVPSPGFPEAKAIIASFRQALHSAPPARLVVLSSIGAQQTSGLGFIMPAHWLEEALADMLFPTAIIRAGSFIENYIPSMEAAVSTGWFDTFRTPTHRPVPMIATADIGKEVARLLTNNWSGRQIIELGSPTTPDELARAMSEVLGRPVQARAIPRNQWSAALEAMGLPQGSAGSFAEMEEGFNSGWIAFGVPGTVPVAATTTPAEVFAQARAGRDGA